MGSFKEFITESEDNLQLIFDILDELSDEELDTFGVYIQTEFLEDVEPDDDDEGYFDLDDVKEMIETLGPDMYDYILDLLQPDEFGDEEHEDTSDAEEFHGVDPAEQVAEGVSRRLAVGDRNRKKRKFMSNTVADLRKTKVQRKRDNRINRPKKKRYYRANKKKISLYQKSRSSAISKGKHITKIRRKA